MVKRILEVLEMLHVFLFHFLNLHTLIIYFTSIAPSADDSRSVVQLGSVVSQSSERLLWKHFEVARVTS